MVTTLIERGINHMLNNYPVFDNINFNGGNLSAVTCPVTAELSCS